MDQKNNCNVPTTFWFSACNLWMMEWSFFTSLGNAGPLLRLRLENMTLLAALPARRGLRMASAET